MPRITVPCVSIGSSAEKVSIFGFVISRTSGIPQLKAPKTMAEPGIDGGRREEDDQHLHITSLRAADVEQTETMSDVSKWMTIDETLL